MEGQADRYVYAAAEPKVAVPSLLYDTMGKFDDTGNMTLDAVLDAGFQGICSANIPVENEEELVGAAIAEMKKQGYKRNDYFLQTRFFPPGLQHGYRTPYDRDAPLPLQIRQSFIGSQGNLNLDKFDAFVWEGATSFMILRDREMEAWSEIENLYLEGRTKLIGISHFELPQIKELYDRAEVKPMIVGQTLHARHGWNRDVRKWCAENGVIFQAHRIFEMNTWVLHDDKVLEMAKRHRCTPGQIVIRFALQSGIALIMDLGTPKEMQQAMDVYEAFELDENEMEYLERIDETYWLPYDM
eukprot:CAMPEP_0114490150 /NCGR_PEP_ID=MMETSP0109-20121206/2282_1 /TAXON_ID=29199 /ORGANISM="Chlorarachnion reptans, Strain CCCM449" /LENGTH=298 /DNA_ID=CAMNT_0001666735 /DNA_START=214 /DNA_END=1110 /DNA_ORIENTATION=-